MSNISPQHQFKEATQFKEKLYTKCEDRIKPMVELQAPSCNMDSRIASRDMEQHRSSWSSQAICMGRSTRTDV
jgi:hypothetical protein